MAKPVRNMQIDSELVTDDTKETAPPSHSTYREERQVAAEGADRTKPAPVSVRDEDEDDNFKEKSIPEPPMFRITRAMADVANGGPAGSLRQLVAELMPRDPELAVEFLKKLERIKLAGEVVFQSGHEAWIMLTQEK
jgi:hypothetical protein